MKLSAAVLVSLASLSSIFAQAKDLDFNVLAATRVDLDRDGKEDTVRVVERESSKNAGVFIRTLEVQLSKAKQSFAFSEILATVSYESEEGCRPSKEEAARFESTAPVSLRANKAGQFVLTEGDGSDDGCNNSIENSWQIGMWDGYLVVEKIKEYFYHAGMGDSKAHYISEFNFMNKTASSDVLDYSDEDSIGFKHWRMPNSCNLRLEGLSKHGIPKCAEEKNKNKK